MFSLGYSRIGVAQSLVAHEFSLGFSRIGVAQFLVAHEFSLGYSRLVWLNFYFCVQCFEGHCLCFFSLPLYCQSFF